jgi:hypothetical protein
LHATKIGEKKGVKKREKNINIKNTFLYFNRIEAVDIREWDPVRMQRTRVFHSIEPQTWGSIILILWLPYCSGLRTMVND